MFDLNAALQQFGYRNAVARPGESSQAFHDRKRREYDAQVHQSNALAQQIHDLEQQRNLQSQWESALQARGLWSPGGTQSQEELDAKLERERQLAFGALADQKGFYDRGTAAEVEQSFLGQMRGSDAPFTDGVVSGLIGREADAEASQLRAEQNMIRSRMANSGLGGSGLATSAMIDAQRAASKRSRAASRDIRTRAELENFNARERARQQAQSFVAQEAANRAAATKQEVDLRSRFQVVGDDRGLDKLAQALAPQQVPAAPAMAPIQRSGRITGNQSQYGGVTFLNGAGVQPFRQTSGGTSYPQFGLGGAAGPWGAIAQSHQIADQNMARSGGNNWFGGGVRSNPIGGGPSFQAPQFGSQNMSPRAGNDALWAQQQANAVAGSAQSVGSQGHAAWLAGRARFNKS